MISSIGGRILFIYRLGEEVPLILQRKGKLPILRFVGCMRQIVIGVAQIVIDNAASMNCAKDQI